MIIVSIYTIDTSLKYNSLIVFLYVFLKYMIFDFLFLGGEGEFLKIFHFLDEWRDGDHTPRGALNDWNSLPSRPEVRNSDLPHGPRKKPGVPYFMDPYTWFMKQSPYNWVFYNWVFCHPLYILRNNQGPFLPCSYGLVIRDIPPRITGNTTRMTSWWFQPIWKILVKLGIFSK